MTLLPENPDWRVLRTVVGGADFVPSAVTRLVHAASADEAYSAYWELDNRVVVQGQLFEAAAWTARAVARAICDGKSSRFGLRRALDLLVEIAAGEADQSEVLLGNGQLGDTCRRELRQYLSCFRRFADSEDDRTLFALLDLLEILEVDREALREVVNAIAIRRAGSEIELRARELGA